MKNFITIITPTYNRGNLLRNCYKSLISQTDTEIEWLIIDDGSIDNTKKIVNEFISENIINIRYVYKENGGKHTALNIAFKEASGYLSLILDSDDILTSNAVETIKMYWNKYKHISDLSSLVFLRKYSDGKIIGQKFSENYKITNHIDIAVNNKVFGDKCEVYLTKILNEYQYPVYKDEKFMSESVVWMKIGRKYKLVCINEAIYQTEYLEGGLTKSGRTLRIKCPQGGIEDAKERMKSDCILKQRIKGAILCNCYSLFAQKSMREIIRNSEYKILSVLNLPTGYLLYKYWQFKYEK